MNLLSVKLARSIWLGPISDLNPKGISIARSLFPFLIDTYKFMEYPSSTKTEDPQAGLKFENGEFEIDGHDYPIHINSLTLYLDGITVDTHSSTNYSDVILDNVLTKSEQLFGGPVYASIIKQKLYVSEVYVSTDQVLERLNSKLKQISNYLIKYFGKEINFQAGGISFWPDPKNKFNPRPFAFERAVEAPFSENRYYSIAPIPTDKHLELLDKLEMILS
ncbi:MAG: hypothetical protein HY788_23930 [Deltaproteobacteria bacterium]|nr:hypothetical protein [Deltaproteobacteria bacterium]